MMGPRAATWDKQRGGSAAPPGTHLGPAIIDANTRRILDANNATILSEP